VPQGVITGLAVAGGVLLVVLGVRAWRKSKEAAAPAASTPRLGTRALRSPALGSVLEFARERANLAAAEVAGTGGRYPT